MASTWALQRLCKQQESRVVELEALNSRKEEQLLKLHGRLEEALVVLQAGQRMYAEQQRVLDAQQASIAEICQKRVAAGTASFEIEAAAAPLRKTGTASDSAPSRQAQAADANTDSGTDGSLDGADTDADTEAEAGEEMAELARRAGELQAQLEALEAAAASAIELSPPGAAARAVSRRLHPQPTNTVQQAAASAVQEAPRLLQQLQGLIAQKDRLEAQLRQEQNDLDEQLQQFEQEGVTERRAG